MTHKKGKIIAFEGADGAGKSTQIRMLKNIYPEAVFTREPGGTAFAEEIRSLIFKGEDASAETHFMLFWAARMEHINKFILPALMKGKIVFTDRFDLSTFAYQLRGQLDTKDLDTLFWQIRQQLVVPKIGFENLSYIYLDMDVETSIRRLADRDGEVTHFDKQSIDFHQRVRDGGREFIRKVNQASGAGKIVCYMIDAGFDADTVNMDVIATVKKILNV